MFALVVVLETLISGVPFPSAVVDKVRNAREVVFCNNDPTIDFGFSQGEDEEDEKDIEFDFFSSLLFELVICIEKEDLACGRFTTEFCCVC